MSRQKAGLKFEHDLASEIYDLTGGSVMPLRAGFSGNQGIPSPDLLIPYKGTLRALEIKTSSQKRLIVTQDDVEDIVQWAMDMSQISTYPYITVKFTHYEAKTLPIVKPWDLEESFSIIDEEYSPFDTNVTQSGNISFGHPSEYDCDVTSAKSSQGDGVAVLRDLKEDKRASIQETNKSTVGVHQVLRNRELNLELDQ